MILKFRAWDKREQKMWTPGITKDGLPFAVHPISAQMVVMDGELLDPIMQFTGLTDKNGKDIYAGDIVDDMFDCGQLHIIYYNEEKAAFCKKAVKASPMLGRTDMPISISVETTTGGKVIGNIHQHSHLLDKGE